MQHESSARVGICQCNSNRLVASSRQLPGQTLYSYIPTQNTSVGAKDIEFGCPRSGKRSKPLEDHHRLQPSDFGPHQKFLVNSITRTPPSLPISPKVKTLDFVPASPRISSGSPWQCLLQGCLSSAVLVQHARGDLHTINKGITSSNTLASD